MPLLSPHAAAASLFHYFRCYVDYAMIFIDVFAALIRYAAADALRRLPPRQRRRS